MHLVLVYFDSQILWYPYQYLKSINKWDFYRTYKIKFIISDTKLSIFRWFWIASEREICNIIFCRSWRIGFLIISYFFAISKRSSLFFIRLPRCIIKRYFCSSSDNFFKPIYSSLEKLVPFSFWKTYWRNTISQSIGGLCFWKSI